MQLRLPPKRSANHAVLTSCRHVCAPTTERGCHSAGGGEEEAVYEGAEAKDNTESEGVHGSEATPSSFPVLFVRIQLFLSPVQRHPAPVKKLPPRYQKPVRKQPDARRKPGPAPSVTHPPSRVRSTAGLTKSTYTKKVPSEEKKSGSRGNREGGGRGKGRDGRGAKNAETVLPPNVPLPPDIIQTLSKAAGDLPPPPAPVPPPLAPVAPPPAPIPPPPTHVHPPPPSIPPTSHKIPKAKTRHPKKGNSESSTGINLAAILSARQKLKRTELGQQLEQGEMTSTADEVACLVRSGATGVTSSLTKDGASFLRRRMECIKEVTQMSDSESDSDWDDLS